MLLYLESQTKCKMTTNFISLFGLILDIVGAYLLYVFAIPNLNLGGGSLLVSEDFDEKEYKYLKAYYDTLTTLGIRLIILGFVVQLSYYFIPPCPLL